MLQAQHGSDNSASRRASARRPGSSGAATPARSTSKSRRPTAAATPSAAKLLPTPDGPLSSTTSGALPASARSTDATSWVLISAAIRLWSSVGRGSSRSLNPSGSRSRPSRKSTTRGAARTLRATVGTSSSSTVQRA